MTKYLIDWSISDTIEIEADSPQEAKRKFDQISNVALAAMLDERDVLEGPNTKEDRAAEKAENERAWERWKAGQAEREAKMPWREPSDTPPELGGPISMRP